MKKELMERASRILWGAHGWKGELAKQMSVNPRTVIMWANGTHPPPRALAAVLYQQMRKRRLEMILVGKQLSDASRDRRQPKKPKVKKPRKSRAKKIRVAKKVERPVVIIKRTNSPLMREGRLRR